MAKTTKKPAKKAAKKTTGRKFEEVVNSGGSWWNPKKKNESVEGTLIEFITEPKKGKFAEQQRPVIETDEGQRITLPGHAVLVNKLAGLEDTYVICTFLGKAKGKKGKSDYYDYKVQKEV